ncbi:hypothetical protein [Cellulomonas dongxiuzhuiae]|uniref:hypothetical protein n=1 Tax=Cellulomonas dongxiuzhuiae TaxID=2819979 RepID=UPI001AAF5F90|nr:hypothetical protein [Cellulomonas dongxiuzhuiae]MBO3088266.1 hypothetical protein [Cellulomonas dongxiuzhuiae]
MSASVGGDATRYEPLFRDPVHDGAADPVVVWNPHERVWWMFFTARRTTAPRNGVGWVHGTGIGVASSSDHGATWTYRGEVDGLDTEWGVHTYWAPEVLEHDGTFHMYVSYIRGIPTAWAGHARTIRHYTSRDLHTWSFVSTLELSSDRVIDAAVRPVPGGGFRMWFKDEADSNNIWAADSADLFTWTVRGPAVVTDVAIEGPVVFDLGGTTWMLADAKCQRLYRTDDLDAWEHVATFLTSADRSDRIDDVGPGLHASVVVAADRAFVFYFTHPERHDPNLAAADPRRSSVHAAELRPKGGTLVCVRGAEVVVNLSAAEPT